MKKLQRMKRLKSDVGYIRMVSEAQKKHKNIK
jgi:hypothetical protein